MENSGASVAAALKEIGIDATADPSAALQQAVGEERNYIGAQQPVNFVDASRRWAAGSRGDAGVTGLPERLATASRAEALRPDAEFVRSRDLLLASRAAAALGSAATTRPAHLPDPRAPYPPALEAMTREHELNRTAPAQLPPAAQIADVRAKAAEARAKTRGWAGEESATEKVIAKANTRTDAELAAAEANANAAKRHLEQMADAAQSSGATSAPSSRP